jgi:zinc protease
MAWQADLEKKSKALTTDQVNAALYRHIAPKKPVVVAAGDFAAKPAGAGGE